MTKLSCYWRSQVSSWCLCFVQVFALLCVGPLLALAEVRVWKSNAGSHEIRAEMVSASDASVTLKTEDGRELTVPLAKLSLSDRNYVTVQRASTAETADAERQIKAIVVKFYRSISSDKGKLRECLTKQGQDSFDRSPNFFSEIRGPDRGNLPRVAAVDIDAENQTAVADYRIRIKGKSWRMRMLLASEAGAWRSTGIVGPGEGDEKNRMNFNDASKDTVPAGTEIAARQTASVAVAVPQDLLTLGATAYGQGFCAKCHGESGTGTRLGPNIADDEWDHCDGTADGIRQILLTGIKKNKVIDKSRQFGMNPATNLVPESNLDALAEYVISLGASKSSSGSE